MSYYSYSCNNYGNYSYNYNDYCQSSYYYNDYCTYGSNYDYSYQQQCYSSCYDYYPQTSCYYYYQDSQCYYTDGSSTYLFDGCHYYIIPDDCYTPVDPKPPVTCNHDPVAQNDIVQATRDATTDVLEPVTIAILANDTDADGEINKQSVKLVGGTNDGKTLIVENEGTWSVDETTGEVTFTPADGFNGNPSKIYYTVDDNDGATSNVAEISVSYPDARPNIEPVAQDDVVEGIRNNINNELTSVVIDVVSNDSDEDGSVDPTSVSIKDGIYGGKMLVVNGEGTWMVNETTGEITFTPEAGFLDNPTPISYTVKDEKGAVSNEAQVTINYPEIIDNIAPVAKDDVQIGTRGINNALNAVTIAVADNDSDIDGDIDPKTVAIVGGRFSGKYLAVAGEGTWMVDEVTGDITFTPEPDFNSNPTPITYTINDDKGSVSSPASVTITYETAKIAPVANDDVQAGTRANGVLESVVIAVTNNDSDADGSLDLSTISITNSDNSKKLVVDGEGTWVVDDSTASIIFNPESGFNANPTSIKYTITDNDGLESNEASVTVNYPDLLPPVAVDDYAVGEAQFVLDYIYLMPTKVNVLANDTDADGTVEVSSVSLVGSNNSKELVVDEGVWKVDDEGQITFSFNDSGIVGMDGYPGGSVSVDYTIQDNDGLTSSATVTITYPEVNYYGNSPTISKVSVNDVIADTAKNELDFSSANDSAAISSSGVSSDTTANYYVMAQPTIDDSIL